MANEETQGFDDEQFAKITGNLRSMAKVLGLREAFFTDLLRERDDWSFVGNPHGVAVAILNGQSDKGVPRLDCQLRNEIRIETECSQRELETAGRSTVKTSFSQASSRTQSWSSRRGVF